MMGSRRVCIFCESWESGGIESFINSILLHMNLHEIEVDIVAARIKDSVFTSGLKEKGVRFVELSGKLRSIKNYRRFFDLLHERKYDVAHFNLFQGLSLYYVRIAKEEGVPVRIAHSHNTDLRRSPGRSLKLLLHRLGRARFASAATDLWACSQAAADFLFPARLLAERPCRHIPNGIDTERFAFAQETRDAVRAQMGIQSAVVLGNVGRLCYQKNQSFLLEVLAQLRNRDERYRLLLVGIGDDEPQLRTQASELGLEDAVVFYGASSQVEQLYHAMDVFVFPSRFEGLGIAAVEAQAASLPVICSEGIPREAHLTPLIRSVPLEAGTAVWAEEIRRLADGKSGGTARAPRRSHIMVRAAGFDVQDVARLIRARYGGGDV